MFEANALGYTYPSGRLGVRGVTLRGGPGERVVVMGPNGSGKSTLLRLVSTELPSPRGALRLFEGGGNPSAARRRLGVAQDQAVHLDALTGLENGLLFAELYGMPAGEAEIVLEDLFSALGLGDVMNVPVGEYSHGMRRKLLLAEALCHRPDLIVLDEPALGLDPPSRIALIRLLEGMSEDGACVLLATNEPALAERLATRVVFLSDGEVVAQGTPHELLEKLSGTTQIEILVSGEIPPDLALEGVAITLLPGRVVAESRAGASVLPELSASILAAGAKIERIAVREPDLADVFRELTGRDMGIERAQN